MIIRLYDAMYKIMQQEEQEQASPMVNPAMFAVKMSYRKSQVPCVPR